MSGGAGRSKRRFQKGAGGGKRRSESTGGPKVQVTDAPQQRKRLKIEKEAKKLIVILENCPLETAQVCSFSGILLYYKVRNLLCLYKSEDYLLINFLSIPDWQRV